MDGSGVLSWSLLLSGPDSNQFKAKSLSGPFVNRHGAAESALLPPLSSPRVRGLLHPSRLFTVGVP